MTLAVSSAIDSGNIRVVGQAGNRIDLEIDRDHGSDFYQWFHFRLTGAAGQRVELRILNCEESAYPLGWPGYQARWSADRQEWRLAPTSYDDGVLTIRIETTHDALWLAYFAPYSMERHQDLIAQMATEPGVSYRSLGQSLDGQEIDCLQLGEGAKRVWLFGRQHPGEPMAEWWMEGALGRLTDPADPVARLLRRECTFHVVPNMNPDGTRRGHLRTNAAGVNLNREWHAPTAERSPEVLSVRNAMDRTGLHVAIDVHGDEAIPYVFLAGFEGIPGLTEQQGRLFTSYGETLARISPDFQRRHGYPVARPGTANMTMATNQLAERFGALTMTLEMPFKDNDDLPDLEFGWSAARSAHLGGACLDALQALLPDL